MSVNPENQTGGTPFFFEVSKPVNQMSNKELDGFVDEILEAVESEGSTIFCPQCSSKSGLRQISYGLPDGPVDETKYAIGGCCISDNDPTIKCIECGWKGEYVDNMPGAKRKIEVVKLADISKMSDEEIDLYAKKTWGLLARDDKTMKGINMKTSTQEKPYEPYQVKFTGSSLLGESNGIKNFELAHARLSELRDQGKAKCKTNWCKACTIYGLKLEDEVIGHVLKITFPRVVELSNQINIEWSWERPDDEWAKEKGDPAKQFEALSRSSSKPSFYVYMESESYIYWLLGGRD